MPRKTTQTSHEYSTVRIAILGLPTLVPLLAAQLTVHIRPSRTSPAARGKVYSKVLTNRDAADQSQMSTVLSSLSRQLSATLDTLQKSWRHQLHLASRSVVILAPMRINRNQRGRSEIERLRLHGQGLE
jgi:hypothetical protein